MLEEFIWTNLKINGQTPLNRAARNLKCSWKWIEEGGDIVRLANGERLSLRRIQFDKLSVTLSGDGVRKPAIDHLYKGAIIDVEWPGYFDEDGDVAEGDLKRPAVAGSIRYFGAVDGKATQLQHGDPRIVLTTYRPILMIMVDGLDINHDEPAARTSWNLTGEEV